MLLTGTETELRYQTESLLGSGKMPVAEIAIRLTHPRGTKVPHQSKLDSQTSEFRLIFKNIILDPGFRRDDGISKLAPTRFAKKFSSLTESELPVSMVSLDQID